MRRFCPNHEKVRSTTHLLGNTLKPLGGSSCSQSMATPSLAHSLAHALITFFGAIFGGCCTTSTVQPKAPSIHSFALPLYPASNHRCFKRGNLSSVHRSSGSTPSRSMTLALWTLALSTNPWVSTSKWRLRPLTFLPPS